LPFKEAREIARGLGLKNCREWLKYSPKNKRILKIPSFPICFYKNKGWVSWSDWLGTKNIGHHYVHLKKEFLPFHRARKFARSLKLNGQKGWKKYIKGQVNILKIPSNPRTIYKKQWDSWGNWLGTGNKVGARIVYKINHNFFKNWSHNMAYIFGFWFADGSISKSKGCNYFDITQHKDDKYLLEKMSKIMKSNYPIHTNGKNCFRLQFHSKTIVDDIIKLGGKYRKSLDCKFPDIPKKYLPDFIRGHFDGDGSIYCRKNSGVYYATFASGSKIFSESLLNILKKSIPNLKGKVSKCAYKLPNNRSGICYHIAFNANDTIRLRDFMYQNDPELKMSRKWNLFKKTEKTVKISGNRC